MRQPLSDSDHSGQSGFHKIVDGFVLAGWAVHTSGLMTPAAMRKESDELMNRIAACRVGDRPGRLEPRVIKRRRHGYPLMQKPRNVLRAELRKHCT